MTFVQSISASLRAVRRSRYLPTVVGKVSRALESSVGNNQLTFTEGDEEGIEDTGPHRLEVV